MSLISLLYLRYRCRCVLILFKKMNSHIMELLCHTSRAEGLFGLAIHELVKLNAGEGLG